jgi:mannose-6-phosphate isomerase-like protein (cupin superfamily)
LKKLPLFFIFLLISSHSLAEETFQTIVVQPGETLWSISNKYLKDPRRWPDIVKSNRLQSTDPTVALPGARLLIPLSLIKEEFQTAQLIQSIPDVQVKRKADSDWNEARTNMTLHYEDSLRTLKGGQAQVRFPSREIVRINENSYVVLKPEKLSQEVQLVSGDIRASRAKVIMPGGTVVKPQDGKSDYQAKIREDKTEVVFVYKGKVDVTAQGKTVTVPEGYGTHVPKSAPPSLPQPLPNFKDFNPAEINTTISGTLKTPAKTAVVITPPSTEKKTTSTKSKAVVSDRLLVDYHLQLATDEKFTRIVLGKKDPVGTPFEIKKQSIPDGNYYMRVAFLDALGNPGPFSVPSLVIKDSMPPQIKNLTPVDGQKYYGQDSFCDLAGDVEGAALVAVNGEVLFISPTGKFNKFIPLKEGLNKIEVIARDTSSNETTIKLNVYYSEKGISR